MRSPLAQRHAVMRLLSGALLATAGQAAAAGMQAEITAPAPLSLWLNSQPELRLPYTTLPDAHSPYLPGLRWTTPEELPAQEKLRAQLLARLRSREAAPGVAPEEAAQLAALVASLPATGRVVLEKTDPRLLEANPQLDPMLQPGQTIAIPLRPTTVTVVPGNGRLCQVAHSADAYARDYLRQCPDAGAAQQVWIVQPDGLIQRAGVASWNESVQNTPAPGAWIVVQSRNIPWPDATLAQVARLLATQGVAADRSEPPLPAPQPHAASWLTDALSGTGLPPPPRDNAVTFNDWGTAGLLQTPSARMFGAGHVGVTVNRIEPYQRMTSLLQPLDWLEGAIRWSYVRNRPYGPQSFSGNQDYLDKSVDAKVRLWRESAFVPELALGLRDLGGTGLFSGEYLVASKRTGDFDWSLGMGWGYLGARGDLANPLAAFGSNMNTRINSVAKTVGTLNDGGMFHGRTALFGGVQYQSPWQPLLFKLEYDGNDYRHEPQGNNQLQRHPFNLGMVYRPNGGLELALNWERGAMLGFGVTLHDDLGKFYMPKLHDPVAVAVRAAYPEQDAKWGEVSALLEQQTGWRVLQIDQAGDELIVRFEKAAAVYWHGYLDRIVAALHRHAPKEVQVFRIQSEEYGLKLHEFKVDRRRWLAQKTSFIPAHRQQATISEQVRPEPAAPAATLVRAEPQTFSSNAGLYFKHDFGGPEGLLYRLGIGVGADWHFLPGVWWSGGAALGLIDNYDRFVYPDPVSSMPRVRTDVQRYVRNPVTLPVFQLTHAGRLGESQFYSVYGGMLESMYGGIGAEWLYRPWQSPLALGVDINSVRQRGFAQDFSFRSYRTVTGHASLYWDTGFQGVNVTLQAGKYLAGDVGATLELARVFRNGVKMAAFATKTNVPAAVFGEGSFDKGVYVSIPLDALLTRSSKDSVYVDWHPLNRDGGARLDRAFPLYFMTEKQRGQLLDWGPWNPERKTQFGDAEDTFP